MTTAHQLAHMLLELPDLPVGLAESPTDDEPEAVLLQVGVIGDQVVIKDYWAHIGAARDSMRARYRERGWKVTDCSGGTFVNGLFEERWTVYAPDNGKVQTTPRYGVRYASHAECVDNTIANYESLTKAAPTRYSQRYE